MITTEHIIKAALDKFRAPRRQRFIHAGGKGMRTHLTGERILYLPNGSQVKVTTSDCAHVSQVEEDDALHAIARPDTLIVKWRKHP